MVESQQLEYKKIYTGLFSLNYLFQGFTTSMFTVILPIYMLFIITETGEKITPGDISFIASVILIPTALKLAYGILTDKLGIKGFGRRRPWIIVPVMIAGLIWFLLPLLIRLGNLFITVMILGFIINTGVFIGDTALDGLILDICPKERLGRVQGLVWGARSIGMIAGGPVLAFSVITGIFTNLDSTFFILGILMMGGSIFILIIQEPTMYPQANITHNLKGLFKQKEDIKTYFFSFFNSFSEGVILLFLTLFILITIGIIDSEKTSLSLTQRDNQALLWQAYLSLIISSGVIFGAIAGGLFADKVSRKLCVYLAMIYTTCTILLLIISIGLIFLLLLCCLIGIGVGLRHSSYSAMVAQMAKRHPEIDSTYFAWCNSLSNLGSTVGLAIAGLIFALTNDFFLVFLIMGFAQLINLIPFSRIDIQLYEIK